jgi:hypothetical protein
MIQTAGGLLNPIRVSADILKTRIGFSRPPAVWIIGRPFSLACS